MIIKSITMRRGPYSGGTGQTKRGEPFDVKIEVDSVWGLLTITPNEADANDLADLVTDTADQIAQEAIEGMFKSISAGSIKAGGAA